MKVNHRKQYFHHECLITMGSLRSRLYPGRWRGLSSENRATSPCWRKPTTAQTRHHPQPAGTCSLFCDSCAEFCFGVTFWFDAVQAFSAFRGRRVDQAVYFLYFFWFNMFWILGFISISISKLAAMYFIFFCDSVLNWIVFKFLIVCNPSTQLIQKGFRCRPNHKLLWFEIHKGWKMI